MTNTLTGMQRVNALEAIFKINKCPEQGYEIMIAWADEIEAYGTAHPSLRTTCTETAAKIRGHRPALINMFGLDSGRAWADLSKRELRLNRHRRDEWMQEHSDGLRREGQAMVRDALRGL